MAAIQTPVEGFTGLVAGVSFVDGAGESSDSSALSYFERHGYTISHDLPATGAEEAQADAVPAPPADNEHVAPGAELFEPKGNAALEEWQAYAAQKGIPAENVADLKREEIKQLLAE